MKVRGFTISYRLIFVVVIVWGAARTIFTFLTSGSLLNFAPDEVSYQGALERAGPAFSEPLWNDDAWSERMYVVGRTLVEPARLLLWLGIDPLTALRLVSTLYSLASFVILILIIRLARKNRPLHLFSFATLGILTFMFLPSHLLWGNLALREASTEFWSLTAVALAALLMNSPQHRVLTSGAATIGIGISLAWVYSSRSYVAVALALALVATAAWIARRQLVVSTALFVAAVAGSFLGVALLSGWGVPTQSEFSVSVEQPSPRPAVLPITSIVPRTGSTLSPLTYLQRASEKRVANALGANSALEPNPCNQEQDQVSLVTCELLRLPGAVAWVMFRPLWPLDQTSEWSVSATIASAENWLWLVLVVLVLFALATRKSLLPGVTFLAVSYAGFLVAGMALMEGNLGTAFRHKSILLWALCLVLALVGERRNVRFGGRRGRDRQIEATS